MTTSRPAARPLGLLFGGIFLAFGAHLPFWPAFLAGRGFDPRTIGLLLAASYLARVVLLPPVAAFADRHGDVRPTITWIGAVSALAFLALVVDGPLWVVGTLSVLSSLLLLPMTPLTDSLAVDFARVGAVVYGRLRLVGSVAFIIANLAVGRLVAGFGSEAVPWWIGAALVVALLAIRALPAPPESPPRTTTWWRAIPQVLGNRTLMVGIAAGACVQASHATYYAFGTVHWQRGPLHLGPDTIGLLWGAAVAVEVLLFAVAARVERRFDPWQLVAIGGLGGIVRWTITGFDPPLAVLLPLQVLHATTFAAAHLGAIGIIGRATGRGLTATAQGIYSALAGGLLMGIATVAAGELYGHFGGRAYLPMAVLAAIGALLAWRARRGASMPVANAGKPDSPLAHLEGGRGGPGGSGG